MNRRGQITKRKTAGKKGRTVDSSGRVRAQTAGEKKNKRLGSIKRRKSLRKKSSSAKKRSTRFASLGRAKRSKMNVRDSR